MDEHFDKKIETLDLSVRAYNCLKHIGVDTLGEIAQFQEHQLCRVRNMGRRSMIEIEEQLIEHGLTFGSGVKNKKIIPFEYKKRPLDYLYMMYGKSVFNKNAVDIQYFYIKIKSLEQ